MTEASFLCKFIRDNPDSWQRRLESEYSIKCKRDGALAIFNYGYECDFRDPLVQEARGIIIDTERLSVVCFPFRKFGNHNEYYADEIDWDTARVQEKVDGSIIKLWYNEYRGAWQFSTNGMIDADFAEIDGLIGRRFGDIIREADNYGDIPFGELERDSTYIFELVSPDTRVIVDYGRTTLYHIGTRNNLTGVEYDADIGIKKPATFPLHSLPECIEAARILNARAGNEVSAEGYVVVDAKYRRVKVKSPDYLMQHRLRLSPDVSKRTCIELVLGGREDFDTAVRLNPVLAPALKYYDFKLTEMIAETRQLTELAKKLLKEYSGDRGAMARIIAKHPLSAFAFRSLDRGLDAEDIVRSIQIDRMIQLIPTYEPRDLSGLF